MQADVKHSGTVSCDILAGQKFPAIAVGHAACNVALHEAAYRVGHPCGRHGTAAAETLDSSVCELIKGCHAC